MLKQDRNRLNHLGLLLVLLVVTCTVLFPVYWIIITALSTPDQMFSWPVRLIPAKMTLMNFYKATVVSPIPQYVLNSLKITFATAVMVTIIASFGAYGFSRFEFPGKRFLFVSFLAIRMFPLVVTILPLYVLWSRIGLLNTLVSLIITYTAVFLSLATWLLKSFFDAIEVELEQAAMIDGCSRLQSLMRIVVPLARPGITAVFVYIFTMIWNEYMIALTLMETEVNRPLSIGLVTFMGQYSQDWGVIMAGATLGLLPVLVLFAMVQRNFVKGLSEGGLKG